MVHVCLHAIPPTLHRGDPKHPVHHHPPLRIPLPPIHRALPLLLPTTPPLEPIPEKHGHFSPARVPHGDYFLGRL